MTERNFTPREIVDSLDRFIIGQEKAKRCVAIALRNRWRRRQVPEKLRDEIRRGLGEAAPPEYEALIQEYYRSLLEREANP